MGCGHSKINLYSRRGKNSGKRNGAKKTGAVDNETDEEESSVGEPAPEEEVAEGPDSTQHVLPIAEHQPAFEVSASQQNFFKMLDEKIEQGKDYDSTSETEIECEQERRRMLIEQWHSLSQSTQSSLQGSPLVHRRLTRSVSRASERQCAPSTSRQALRHESPPVRRWHSAQAHDPRHADYEPTKSPVKRTQSAGATWKASPKVAPFQKAKEEPVAGCSKDPQLTTTYNPTFQNHSPAHRSQPLKAQIVSYPLSQQVTPPSPVKFIAPPEEYQDAEVADRQATAATQSQIFYIHGSNTVDLAQQRQQTAIHLQQYVAMKQAQQQMFTSYIQRAPHPHAEPRMCEGEELAAQYGFPGLRTRSAPTRLTHEVAHAGSPLWAPLAPVAGTWQVPPEMQYYPQSQFVPMFRAGAGSAGTLTRCRGDKTSLNVVRGKPVGQVVTLGGQELAVAADSPSPAASSDSGVSPGTGSSSKSSGSTPPAAPVAPAAPATPAAPAAPAKPAPPTASAAPTASDALNPKPKKKTRALKLCKSLDS